MIWTISLILATCGDDDEDPAPTSTRAPEDIRVERIIPGGDENYLSDNSDYIFDQDRLHTFELTIPTQNLAKIDANPAAEQYVEGQLTFDGETISPVGVRYKGSVGAFVGCLSGTDWQNPSGHKTCTKLSMKVKINWLNPDLTFYGLKKLQFHSMNFDDSQMHERLGYWLFREMGVQAPRSVHARLIINGQYSGLYALTEQIDGRFARHNFTDGTGNVYKEIWPVDMYGKVYPEWVYIDHLKTNEEGNPSASIIRSFAADIASTPRTELKPVIEKWMDVETIISFAVVDRCIRNDDGPFHWYCGGSGHCSNHNYYWVEEPTESKLYLIPWDLDNAFENMIENVNPVTPIADDWGEITEGCEPFNYGEFRFLQRSAACDKLTAGWVLFDEEYQRLLTEFLDGPYSEVSVNQQLDIWKEQIYTASLEANQTHADALSMGSWLEGLGYLKSSIDHVRENRRSNPGHKR